MIGQLIFLTVLAVLAASVIWRSARKKIKSKGTEKRCCE